MNDLKIILKRFMISEGYGACDVKEHCKHNGQTFKKRATDEEIELRIDNFIKQMPKENIFSLPDEKEVILEALNRYSKPDATFGNPSSLSDVYKKEGWLECYSWLKDIY
jgi:hypothetical protein